MKIVLSLSLLFNLVLLGVLVRLGPSDMGGENLPPPVQSQSSSQPQNQFVSTESTQTHREVLAELEAETIPTQISVASNYWRPVSETALALQASQQRDAEWTRRELYQRFGDEVYEEPVFATYFFPLGPGYEFLTSQQQIQIVEMRDRFQAERFVAMSSGGSSIAAIQKGDQQFQEELKSMLGDDLYFEYQLRDSRLAQQMRSNAFEWIEYEFREVFAIKLRQQENSSSSGATQLAMGMNQSGFDPEIENIMGNARYIEYLKASDPSYRRLVDQVEAAGGSEADAEQAYEIYAEYAPQISEAMQDRNPNLARSLQTERDSRVTEATGLYLSNAQPGSTQLINPDFFRQQ